MLAEISQGERFAFGANWQRFLRILDDERIDAATASLRTMLGVESLSGLSFADVGSGSGLFSLAARRLGARVHSFDYDPQSVACTAALREHYFPEDAAWTIRRGSVLDREYLSTLGQFDVVYSWGVLHHTGAMWEALKNVSELVNSGGQLFISIYNDQELKSRAWARVKRAYCSGAIGKYLVLAVFVPYFAIGGLAMDTIQGRNPVTRYAGYKKRYRGMSVLHDWVDWLGGYPFEVAKPEQVFDFYRRSGFVLERLKTCGAGLGCNEYLFRKNP